MCPAYRATLLYTKVTASNFCFMQYFNQRLFGSDWDLVDSKSLLLLILVHNPRGTLGTNFSYTHEYAFFIIPKGQRSVSNRVISADDLS